MDNDLQAQINIICRTHSIPQEQKLTRRLERLERMKKFYEDKSLLAPIKQAILFKSFVSALEYSIETLNTYQKLTVRLNELAQEDDTIELLNKDTED